MKRGILILLILFCFAAPPFVREAQAMDPVTIAILTPIAIKGAQVAAPYVMRGLASGARHMVSMGYDLINFFRLPLGFLQVTAGIPFGSSSRDTLMQFVSPRLLSGLTRIFGSENVSPLSLE